MMNALAGAINAPELVTASNGSDAHAVSRFG
jgi:hypothetical protein